MRTVIGVMGGGRADAATSALARAVGALIAAEGWVLLNGGRDCGVMAASAAGAAAAGGLVIGILPDDDFDGVAPGVDIAIPTGMGDARNVINILASHVVLALPGGAGTISEVAHALKAGRPVVVVGWDPGEALRARRWDASRQRRFRRRGHRRGEAVPRRTAGAVTGDALMDRRDRKPTYLRSAPSRRSRSRHDAHARPPGRHRARRAAHASAQRSRGSAPGVLGLLVIVAVLVAAASGHLGVHATSLSDPCRHPGGRDHPVRRRGAGSDRHTDRRGPWPRHLHLEVFRSGFATQTVEFEVERFGGNAFEVALDPLPWDVSVTTSPRGQPARSRVTVPSYSAARVPLTARCPRVQRCCASPTTATTSSSASSSSTAPPPSRSGSIPRARSCAASAPSPRSARRRASPSPPTARRHGRAS
jgi:uncharacterized protein (TIGR00725 family)